MLFRKSWCFSKSFNVFKKSWYCIFHKVSILFRKPRYFSESLGIFQKISVLFRKSQCFPKNLCAFQKVSVLFRKSLCFSESLGTFQKVSVLIRKSHCFTRKLLSTEISNPYCITGRFYRSKSIHLKNSKEFCSANHRLDENCR